MRLYGVYVNKINTETINYNETGVEGGGWRGGTGCNDQRIQ